jgi:hypothetical protein
MALKIFTGAKAFLKAGIKPFGITEIEMLPSHCSIPDRKCPEMDISGFFFQLNSLKKFLVQFLLIRQT